MMIARINKIIPFSNVDGPGNRLVVFFQGCAFNCLYCHNPETINHCNHCGKCVEHCPAKALNIATKKVVYAKDKCVECDTCTNLCPYSSSPKVMNKSLAEVLEIIKENKDFIKGITTSGGECMMQSDFLLALFKGVKKMGLTCLIDTNGMYDFRDYQPLLEVTDGVILDVKAWDLEFHKKIIGSGNETVLKNLHYLIETNKLHEVRTVMLPNFHQQNELTVRNVVKIIPKNMRYKLLIYQEHGVRKKGKEFFKEDVELVNRTEQLKAEFSKLGYINITVN